MSSKPIYENNNHKCTTELSIFTYCHFIRKTVYRLLLLVQSPDTCSKLGKPRPKPSTWKSTGVSPVCNHDPSP